MSKKSKLSAEERAILNRLLAEESENDGAQDDDQAEKVDDTEGESSEEFIVFRGSVQAFSEKFGLKPPEKASDPGEEPTEEPEEDKPKKEPKARSRARYFGG